MFGPMGELSIRCICGARLQMLSNQSGKTALCPRCRITISAPRPKAFELWNGEELSLEELQNIERHEVRDVVTDLDKTTELPPTNSTVADSASHSTLGTQFAEIAKLLESHPTHPLLDSPVSEWIEPSDICLPFKFLSWSLRGVLETPFTRIASSWTGDERLALVASNLRWKQHTSSGIRLAVQTLNQMDWRCVRCITNSSIAVRFRSCPISWSVFRSEPTDQAVSPNG